MPAQVLKRGGSVLGNENDQTKHERFGYAAELKDVETWSGKWSSRPENTDTVIKTGRFIDDLRTKKGHD